MNDQQILESLRKLGKSEELSFLAVVKANHIDTVDVVDLSGTKYEGVRKKAAITGTTSGMLITPALNSTVIVSRIGESDELFLEMVSEIESIVMDGGANGGLAITPKLVEELNKNNALLESIITIISGAAIPEPGSGSPSALQTALKTAIAGKQLGDFSEIENNKFKH